MLARLKKLPAWLKRPLTEQFSSFVYNFLEVRDRMYEKRRGLEFGGYIAKEDMVTGYSGAVPHATWYDGLSAVTLRMMLREIEKTGMSFSTFIDIGSGKGKVCIYAEILARFRTIIGVEFSHALVELAERNKQKAGSVNVSFLTADASEYSLPEGNCVVFLFNPFDEVVLEKFIANNIGHFKTNQSVISYANDHHRGVLLRHGFQTISRNQAPNMSLYAYRPGI